MIALSGVRSSCDMLARNSDLCLLASSSSRLLAWISLNRREFWIAITAWSAKVLSSASSLSLNGCGGLRETWIAPTPRPSQSIGAKAIEKLPFTAAMRSNGAGTPGVGEHVGKVDDAPLADRDLGRRALDRPRKFAGDRADDVDRVRRLGAKAARAQQAVVVDQVDAEPARREQPLAAVEDLVEHRLGVGDRAADDLQHLGGRGLLLERLLGLVEQANVLDRDDGLVGEGLEQIGLALRRSPDSGQATTIAPIGWPSFSKGAPIMRRQWPTPAACRSYAGSLSASSSLWTRPDRMTRPLIIAGLGGPGRSGARRRSPRRASCASPPGGRAGRRSGRPPTRGCRRGAMRCRGSPRRPARRRSATG